MQQSATFARPEGRHLSGLYSKEDWWAVWIGLGGTAIALALFRWHSSIFESLAINPGGLKWKTLSQLQAHFEAHAGQYAIQFVTLAVIFAIALAIMGTSPRRFLPAFAVLYVLSLAMFAVSGWVNAGRYNMEAPLMALILGLVIANVAPLPRWMDSGFRVEFYVKTGIVLLGATFPLGLILSAGPLALLQATVVSLATCGTIYFVATRVLGLDRRLAAVLGTGGAVCGVSASVAIASSVRAPKDQVVTSVTLVVIAALVMVVLLPFAGQALHLPAGVGGAWIGSSEFADAAGLAAATTYGGISGHLDQAVRAFTLMKVIGRDVWIGIWAFAWGILATTVWERSEAGARPGPVEIWRRFPKFIIGFFVASILVSLLTATFTPAEINKIVKPHLLNPISSFRSWTFIFCFLSIGLTTRFRELRGFTWKPAAAFAAGVVVNVILAFLLSVVVFGGYWAHV